MNNEERPQWFEDNWKFFSEMRDKERLRRLVYGKNHKEEA